MGGAGGKEGRESKEKKQLGTNNTIREGFWGRRMTFLAVLFYVLYICVYIYTYLSLFRAHTPSILSHRENTNTPTGFGKESSFSSLESGRSHITFYS